MTKKKQKKLEENQKNKHEPETKHSLKSFGFLVFWFSRGFLVFGFPHGFSPKESSNSWLVPLNLEKTKNQKTSRKPKNQKTKTFQRMFGLRLMFGFFWFSSSVFGFFGHDLGKTKKTQGFFGFLKELLLEVSQKTKKLRSFLVFWTDF